MANTCILYGATSWIVINLIIILIAMLLSGVAFSISTLLSANMRERIRGAARSELTQALLSAVIIVALVGTATTACSLSSSMSKGLTHTSMDPFQYSEYYVGNLSVNTGLNMLTNAYSTSVSYAIEGQVLGNIGDLFNTKFTGAFGIMRDILGGEAVFGNLIKLSFAGLVQLSLLFNALSGFYIEIIVPMMTVAVGMLFLQFLLLPLLQYTAFTVVLPVAIAMRSLSFLGNNLRVAANSVLAIAIAAYIIYPLMLSMNGWAIAWIFSSANPSYQYVQSTYVVPNIPLNTYFTSVPSTAYSGPILGGIKSLAPLLMGSFASTGIILPWQVVSQAQFIVNELARFLFESIVMIVIDIAVTIGFAASLAKALNRGIEGAGSFWG